MDVYSLKLTFTLLVENVLIHLIATINLYVLHILKILIHIHYSIVITIEVIIIAFDFDVNDAVVFNLFLNIFFQIIFMLSVILHFGIFNL